MKKIFLTFTAIAIISALSMRFSAFSFLGLNSQNGKNELLVSAEADAYVAPDTTLMSEQINAIITAHPELQIGVSVVNLKNNQAVNYGVAEPFEAASTGKLITAVLFMHRVEQGQDSLSETLGGLRASTQLQKMIVDSDNTAWKVLNDHLSHAELKQYASEIGINSYSPDKNTISVSDEALLLSKLYQKKLLNPGHTTTLLGYMKNAEGGNYISKAVPSGVTLYHKAGWLDDRAHDVAIIDDGKQPYVLAIFTKANSGMYDFTAGPQIFQQITSSTTQVFIK